MFKMILGAGLVVVLVGFGIVDTNDIQSAGDTAAKFAKNDVAPLINRAAIKIVDVTK